MSNVPNNQSFYRLKVEDALSYLDQVKLQFARQPDVYNQFLDIMKEFKSQSIDTPGVISRVSTLFKGHTDLIEGFNTFLPPGYKIEVQENDSVHVTSPNSLIPSAIPSTLPNASKSLNTVNIQPAILNINSTNASTTNVQLSNIKLEQGVTSMLNALNFLGTPPTTTTAPINIPPSMTTTNNKQLTIIPPTTPPLPQPPQPITSRLLEITPLSTTAAVTTTVGQAAPTTTTTPNQVEFGHAISYVNKIKNRFQNQPDVYKAFLDILHAYQKQQKQIKDGLITSQTLSEAEVYSKVAKLFKNQEDLLIEFSQFLPDANSAANTAQTTATLNETTNLTKQIETSTTTISSSSTQGGNKTSSSQINSNIKTSKHSTKQLKSQSNQENNTSSTSTPATTNKNLISNMPKSSSNNNPQQNNHNSSTKNNNSSSHTMTNSGSVKRTSSNNHLATKKQKLALKQSNSNNNITNSNCIQPNNNTLSTISPNTNYNDLMQINDADYINSINEVTFFEYVKKALRTPEVYKNFLRCIALFNQEIVTTLELIKLVEPYLCKFPELYRWFKNYVGDKDDQYNETFTNNKYQINKERIDLPAGDSGGVSLEIDYSSLKQYGASYREISSAPYSQSICSGRNTLCKEVLNDTFVSFPCWSEDTTFLTSKKNQYEELLFRTEDERFELDVILETNASAIRILESVQKKMIKMEPEERNKYRLDNCLGGSSDLLHVKAIKRIYGEKAKEFIEGIKRNPAVAVPLVLKRLKAKDEEWREAKKNFEKQWREQTEKNYLKSLDYCAVPFKQSDQKQLKNRSLLNEIETIYFERQEAKEEGGQEIISSSSSSLPHLTFKYEDKTILEDVAALIIHHVKRQAGIPKEDKQKMKQIVYHFLPDLFFVPRGALSDDEADEGEDDDCASGGVNKKKEKKHARHTDTNKRRLTDLDDKPKDIPEEYKSPDDMYRLFFVDDHWYLFFRYHHILCERLYKIYKHSMYFAEQESKEAQTKQKSVADALKLRNKCKLDTAASEFYPTFLDIVRNLLDGNIDGCQYEDTLREMFGIHAYIVFTLDKVVQNCVRQLQYIVQEETCITLRHYYLDEQKMNATGGKVLNMQSLNTQNIEMAYQKKVESLLHDQNCFKTIMYKNSGRLTVELLDTEDNLNENEMNDIEKWSEYIEKYCGDENNIVNDEIKEALLAKPVFLTRTAHNLKQKFQEDEKKMENLEIVDNTVCKFDVNSYKLKFEPNTGSFMYRKNSIKMAKKTHHSITKGMYDRFKKYLNKWLKDNATSSDSIYDWLTGETINNPNIKTTCIRDNSIKRPPFHAIFKYKTEKLNPTSTSIISKSKSSSSKTSPLNNNNNNIENDNATASLKQEVDLKQI